MQEIRENSGSADYQSPRRREELPVRPPVSADRTYYHKALKVTELPSGRALAKVAMEDYLGKVFKTERDIKELREERLRTGGTLELDEVLKLRREKSAPVLAAFKRWIEDLLPGAPPQSALRKALAYTTKQWPKLVRHLEYPEVPAHNNYLENLIRPFSQGRRVWLFANNPLGARASANLYSLVATARANGLEPCAYLFENLPRPSRPSRRCCPGTLAARSRPPAAPPEESPLHDPPRALRRRAVAHKDGDA